MKYWSYLLAKLVAAAALLWGFRRMLVWLMPPPKAVKYIQMKDPFATDLGYTFAVMLYSLLAAGGIWLIVLDQRYRCRTCLRRLRMPVHTGSWTHVLFGGPQTEYICLYGHGTLKVDDLQITGRHEPDWEPHEDIWKELYSLEETTK